MSYDSIESSVDSGRPIELLHVTFLTNHYTYTSAEINVFHDGFTYESLPISHSPIAPASDVAKSSITVSVPEDCQVGELFRVQPPTGVVTMTLFSMHVGEPDVKVIWKGRVVNVEWEQPWLHLTSENVYSSLQRMGVRRKFSSQCTHALYSTGAGLCNVDRAMFRENHVVQSVSGLEVVCPSITRDEAYFAGGSVSWVHNSKGYEEKRMVTASQNGGVLTLSSPPAGLIAGQTISVLPGCDHSLNTCHSKYNNTLNFGGTPFIPQKNPFGGSTLY